MLFFFFKQKTAYEMRISDWSSDVCSSDLARIVAVGAGVRLCPHAGGRERVSARFRWRRARRAGAAGDDPGRAARRDRAVAAFLCGRRRIGAWLRLRSEEHTSELPSLMRISYAVFCLKKKNLVRSILFMSSLLHST